MTRLLALCADDFGQSAAISSGIAALAAAGRLSAISCLVTSPHWAVAAPRLAALPRGIDIGLHFNLTEGVPLSPQLRRVWPRFPGLARLIGQAHLGLLPRAALRAEFAAQLAAFSAAAGQAPAHIDGHQHVHHLPLLRDIVLEAAERVRPQPALRNTGRILGRGFRLKQALIAGTGGRRLARELERRRLPHNPALLGVYDFAEPDYRGLMQRWLAELPSEGGLLFCHPGDAPAGADDDAHHADRADRPADHADHADHTVDPIVAARLREHAYLASDAFAQDLAAADVRLGRVWQT